jgi:hypothetical protein
MVFNEKTISLRLKNDSEGLCGSVYGPKNRPLTGGG